MAKTWKSDIIKLTELEAARERKIDASFFPPVPQIDLATWEAEQEATIPDAIRSYMEQSDGLEAQRGEIWPVLPLQQWTYIDDACACADPLIRFGETEEYFYHISLGHSPSIYRAGRFGSPLEFAASGFRNYLELVFQGRA